MNAEDKKFKITANLVILSVNIPLNKRYILSLAKDDIVLPNIGIDKNQALDINKIIINYLQKMRVSDNHLLLMPQIVSLDSQYINGDDYTLNPIFGLLIDYSEKIIDCYWFEFEYAVPNKYSNLIIEVAQKLQ